MPTPSPPRPTPPRPGGDPAPAAVRVLVAEDEALIRLDLKEMLEEEGYDVCGEAGDGQTAVRLAEELRPGLVILDIKMPVLDGLAAAEQIAARRIAPVVILTAFGQRDLVERASQAGAMAYLTKPFQKKDLLPTIEMARSRYAEMMALEAEVGDLAGRLEARKVVERAKGVLTSEHAMTEPEAFRWVQRAAMNRRQSMRQVAEGVLAGTDRPAAGTAGSLGDADAGAPSAVPDLDGEPGP